MATTGSDRKQMRSYEVLLRDWLGSGVGADRKLPRDRHGSFEPQLIPKHQTRWAGFDDKIISLYARGMTVRERYRPTSKRCMAPKSHPA